jgi:archaellum biogenesis protein FlaJ (TadC family)
MNDKENTGRSRNVAPKDLLAITIAVAVVIVLLWYKETGSKIATIIIAIIPIVGLLYYLKVPAEKRRKAEQVTNLELRESTIGKLWIGFLWLLGILVVLLMILNFLK